MKKIYKITGLLIALTIFSTGCSDFNDINERPDAFTGDEVSAKYFLTETQIKLYAPDRYPYWRAQLIHADRYAGHVTFGHNGSWWADGLGYTYNAGYTDAAFDWLGSYNGTLSTYLNFVKTDGILENDRYFALGLIMKALYYQMYTDTFGMLPYSEASDPDNLTPQYDTQAEIYAGLIDELNQAMTIIGSHTDTGTGPELLTINDLFFGGDLQQWKKLANSVKLRLALRAYGASGADFASTAITEATQNPLLVSETENVLMEKDPDISQWANAAYGDVWHNFGGLGSKWSVGETLINYLRDNNDPRLGMYAQPIAGGTVDFLKPESDLALYNKRVDYILSVLDHANVPYTETEDGDKRQIVIPDGVYYVGQPSRINAETYPFVSYDLFSKPAEIITNPKNQGKEIFPEIVFTAAEGNFLQAEAILKGVGSGDAQSFYQEGIRQAMLMWEVSEADINTFLANEPMAQLNGSAEENLEKVAIQRWIAAYTDGFEAWAIVRDTGYPSELAAGVSDLDIYSLGTLNGEYPQRLRYGNNAYNTNGANTEQAVSVQGPDVQGTKLWWAK